MIEELKKYLFHCRWLAIILGFLMLKITVSLLNPFSGDAVIEQNKTLYLQYLSEFGGRLTAENEQKILAEFDRINDAESETEAVRERFLKGEIASVEFAEKINKLSEITSRGDVFLKIFEQYEYAAQNPDRREIIYTAGWEKLLANESPDLLLVLLIVLLFAQIFAREHETGMAKILLPTKNGRASLCAKKLAVCILTAVCCTVFFEFIDIGFAAAAGLGNFSAPLESLPVFFNTPEHISLASALVLTCLIRILGYAFFAEIVLIFSSVIKKTLPAMCVSFGLILIQFAGLDASDFKYRFVLPYGLMLAGGYLKGESNSGNVHFSAVSPRELAATIAVSVLISVVLAIFVTRSFSSKKRLKKLAVLLGLPIILCGCSSQSKNLQMFRLNGSEWTDSSDFVFSYAENGLMIDKTTGVSTEFIRNPFYDIKTNFDKTPITAPIFSTGNKAYFLHDNGLSIVITERNLDDMSDKIIYQSVGDERDYFLGLGHSYAKTHSCTIHGFFLNDRFIYFVTDRGITQVDRLTSYSTEIITDAKIENVIFDGKDICFISSDFTALKFLTGSGKTEPLLADKVSEFIIVGDRIFYGNISDGKKLYMCSLEGNEKKKLADLPIKSLTTDGDFVYFIASEELFGSVYRTALDGGFTEEIFDGDAYFIDTFNGFSKVIVQVHDESGMMTALAVEKE